MSNLDLGRAILLNHFRLVALVVMGPKPHRESRGLKADRRAPAGSSQIISEEKLIASFINPKAQKSLESVRSKSRTPRRKAEGEELLRAIEAFDALLFSDTKVGTTKGRHK
ncbi:hypothetical protein MTO96_045022 [Rhipicephalus appendiculatus]